MEEREGGWLPDVAGVGDSNLWAALDGGKGGMKHVGSRELGICGFAGAARGGAGGRGGGLVGGCELSALCRRSAALSW